MQLVDQDQRTLITTELEKNIFVEAGAGSGKTTAMVSRIIEVLAKGITTIDRIVAITFTNEGAASLRLKIQTQLEEQAKVNTRPPNEQTKLADAIKKLSLARISTIHSFCTDLLRERPVEAGLDPDFEVGAEQDGELILNEIWTAFILQHSANADDDTGKFLAGEFVDLGKVYDMVKKAIENPDLPLISTNDPVPSFDEANNVFGILTQMISELKNLADIRLAGNLRYQTDRDRKAYVLKLEKDRNAVSENRLDVFKFLLRYSPVDPPWSPDEQADFLAIDNQIKDAITGFQNRYNTWVHGKVCEIIKDFREYYLTEKKKRSSLGFDDLLFLTKKLLKEKVEVRNYFKQKYSKFFVDEVQDNDPLQTEILFFLSEALDSSAAEWNEVKLEPGKLFMVGDPKQSIYRFRRADITVYKESKEIILAQDGLLCTLTTNFRSSSTVIDFANGHFKSSFSNYSLAIGKGYHPDYAPLDVNPERESTAHTSVYLNLTDRAGGIEAEAAKTAGFIKHLVEEQNFKYNDVMILFRKGTNMQEYRDIFEEARIPYYEVGEKEYFKIPLIRTLISALQAIDDPTDTIALYSALRSPVFGFSDKELFNLVKNNGRISLFLGSNKETEDRALAAIGSLRELFYRKDTLRPSGVLKAILNQTGLTNVILKSKYGQQAAAKVFRLVEMLHDLEQDTSLSFSGVMRGVKSVMGSSSARLGTIQLSTDGANAVRFMTIHKAKGLEAPVVIMADAFSERWNKQESAFTVKDNGRTSLILKYSESGFGNLNPDEVVKEDKLKNESEEERLRYVAATRACDVLMICLQKDDKKSHNSPFLASMVGNNSEAAEGITLWDKGLNKEDPEKQESDKEKNQNYNDSKKERADKLEKLREIAGGRDKTFRNVHEEAGFTDDVYRHPGRRSFGKEFGSMVHKLMEYHITIPQFDPAKVIDRLMDDLEVSPKLKEEVLGYYRSFCDNKFVKEAKASEEKYAEWEFAHKQPDGSFITGVIDLVYRLPGGTWVIVDYKTDDVSNPEYKDLVDTHYRKQVGTYKECFEALTGEKVERAEIVYKE